MHPDAAALLWDARDAGRLVQQFVADKDEEMYLGDVLLRSAVQRQVTIVGEAINRLSKLDPETTAWISDVPKIVGLRNVLVHGYTSVDDHLVWRIVTDSLPTLLAELDALLDEVPE